MYMYMYTCIHVYSTASPTTGNKTDLICNHFSYLDTRLRGVAELFVVQFSSVQFILTFIFIFLCYDLHW